MIFGKKEDWKELLNEETRLILDSLMSSVKKHRAAYSYAGDQNIAQLWLGMTELKKEIDDLKKILGKLEEPFKAMISVGEAEKKKAIERLITEIVKPSDEETKEATKKLVESLMKF